MARHEWLRFVWPWRSKHYARKIWQVQPDVVHIQSHIVIGRGLPRDRARARDSDVATNHMMAGEHRRLHQPAQVEEQIFVKLAWADAKRTFALTAP